MSASARHHRPVNYALWAVVCLFFCFAFALPGIVRGQPINEGFDNFIAPTWTIPAGWTFNGISAGDNYTTPGDYGVASPSIKLNGTGDSMAIAPLDRPGDLTFWVKGIGTDLTSNLYVEEYYLGTGWSEVTTVMPLPNPGRDLGPFPLSYVTTAVRFNFIQHSTGAVAFDDVVITEAPPSPSPPPSPTPVVICEGFDDFIAPFWEIPPGWEFIGIGVGDNYTESGYYGVASPSLKLDSTGDQITNHTLYRPGGLTFWVRGQGEEISCALLVEEYYDPAGWMEVTTVRNFPTVEGAVLGPFPLQYPSTKVIFTYAKDEGTLNLAFDDVCILQADPTPSVPPTPLPTAPTPQPSRTPIPTPVPVAGPIQGRVYDRVTGVGVGNLYVVALPVSAPRPAGDITDASGNYRIDGINTPLDAGSYQVFCNTQEGFGIRRYRDQWYDQKDTQVQADLVSSNSAGIDFPLYPVNVYPTPVPTPSPSFSIIRVESGDYSGDGISDIAVFRPATGLWAVRGVTRDYFGGAGDIPVSGDYSGDGFADLAVFRGAYGLWVVQGVTRSYFGRAGDIPIPGDYDGDGSADIAVFRPISGLWAVAGHGRSYFGASGDLPVGGDYDGDGFLDIAVFRPATGLWAVKDVTRVYFGRFGDTPVPGDYDGLGVDGPAIYRSSSGLWAIRGWTRTYFGSAAYQAVPANYSGADYDWIGVFRPDSGLWAIRGLTKVYFGRLEDLPATR